MRSGTGKMYDEILVQLATDPKINKSVMTQILKTISEVLVKTLDVERISIYMINADHQEFLPVDIYDSHDRKHHLGKTIRFQSMKNFIGDLKTSRFLDIFNLVDDPYNHELKTGDWKIDEVKSVLFIPIRSAGQLIGLLRIDQIRSRRIWVEEEILFASQVADTLGMVFLNHELIHAKNTSELILSFVQDIQKIRDFEQLSEKFVNYLAKAIHADSLLIFKVDPFLKQLWTTHTYQAPIGYEKLVLAFQEGIAGVAAEEGKYLLSQDYAAYPNREKIYDETKPYTMVMVKPVVRDGNVVAVIQAMRSRAEEMFNEFDQCVMEQMVSWYGVLMDQVKLENNLYVVREYQRTLNRVIEASYFTSGIQDLLNTTMDYCMPVLKTRMAVVVLDTWKLVRGLPESFATNLIDLLLENETWKTSVISVKTMHKAQEIHPALFDLIKDSEIQSFMLAPIMFDERRIGFLMVASNLYSDWDKDEVVLLEVTCKHLALEYRRVQTFLENQNRSNLAWRLNKLGHKFSHTLTYESAMEIIGNAAVDLFIPDQGFLLIRDPKGAVKNAYSYAIPTWKIQQLITTEKELVESLFMNTLYPLLIEVEQESNISETFISFLEAEQVKALKILPLLYQEQPVGVFVASYKKSISWPDYEREEINIFARMAVLTLQNAWMYDELEKGYLDLALALAGAVEEREASISDSMMKIANWAEKTARYLGCTEDEIQDIRWAALLHDIGKLEVPDHILRKPGPLSKDEWDLVRKAPEEAEKLIKPLTRYHNVGLILSSYHEHYDGSGYPNKLKGRNIPLGARILALAEAYVSMIDHRSYRDALQPKEALKEIKENRGKQFDPIIVDAFINALTMDEVEV